VIVTLFVPVQTGKNTLQYTEWAEKGKLFYCGS